MLPGFNELPDEFVQITTDLAPDIPVLSDIVMTAWSRKSQLIQLAADSGNSTLTTPLDSSAWASFVSCQMNSLAMIAFGDREDVECSTSRDFPTYIFRRLYEIRLKKLGKDGYPTSYPTPNQERWVQESYLYPGGLIPLTFGYLSDPAETKLTSLNFVRQRPTRHRSWSRPVWTEANGLQINVAIPGVSAAAVISPSIQIKKVRTEGQ